MKSFVAQLLIISLILTSCGSGGGSSSSSSASSDLSKGLNLSGVITSISNFIIPSAMAGIPTCTSTCDLTEKKCATLTLIQENSSDEIKVCDTEISSTGEFNFKIADQDELKNYMAKVSSDNFKETKREIVIYIDPDQGKNVRIDVTPSTTATANIIKDEFRNDPENAKNGNVNDHGQLLQNDLINMCPSIINSSNVLEIIRTKLGVIASSSKSSLIIQYRKRIANSESLADIQDQISLFCNSITRNDTSNLSQFKLTRPAEVVGSSIGSNVFFAGGDYLTGLVDVFNSSSGSHTVEFLSEPRTQVASTTIGERLFVIGGYKYIGTPAEGQVNAGQPQYAISNRIDIYNNTSKIWTTASLLSPRLGMQVSTFGSKILVSGGWSGGSGSDFRSDVEIIDSLDYSKTTKSLSRGRIGHASVVVGDKAYFIGGIHSYNSSSDTSDIIDGTMDVYNLSTDTLETLSIPRKRAYSLAVASGGKIYIGGGTNNSNTLGGIVDIYDTQNNSWSSVNIASHGNGLVAGLVGDSIIFAGGTSSPNSISIINTVTNSISIRTLNLGRYNLGMSISNGKAFLAGGTGGSDPSGNTDIIEIFDSSSYNVSIYR